MNFYGFIAAYAMHEHVTELFFNIDVSFILCAYDVIDSIVQARVSKIKKKRTVTRYL